MTHTKAMEVINDELRKVLPGIHLPRIYCVRQSNNKYFSSNFLIAGYYHELNKDIHICKDYIEASTKKETLKTYYHEIGHYIHDVYFGYEPQYIPRKHHGDKDLYCNKNHKESFAECFADYMMAIRKDKMKKIRKSKRLSKMHSLVQEINQRQLDLVFDNLCKSKNN